MFNVKVFVAAAVLGLPACTQRPAARPAPAPEYLFLWTGSADSTQPDFLAVLDVSEQGERYGRLVTTLPVPGLRNGPHHTEHEMPADHQLFANGFSSGQTFIFDLTDPLRPRLAGRFGDVEGYTHPHSFLRLPDGHVLATFQMRHEAAGMTPGGLVELTPAVAGLFLVAGLSLAGVPPFSGFFGKLVLVRAGLGAGANLTVLAALATGFLTLYSMVKIWRYAFWGTPCREAAAPGYRALAAPTLVLVILTVALGLGAQPFLRLAHDAAKELRDPHAYTAAVLGPGHDVIADMRR